MNSGILVLQDGTPCFVYDEGPHVKYIELGISDSLISLVYFNEEEQQDARIKTEYPVAEDIADVLKTYKMMAVGRMNGDKVEDLHMVAVNLVES